MICPKCGKDVGEYKYCPDCAVPTIEVGVPAPSSPAPAPPAKAQKKPYAIGRFFAVVAALHILSTILVAFLNVPSVIAFLNGASTEEQTVNYRLICVCVLQIIGLVLCFVFTKHVKFWMLFPCTITGIAILVCCFTSQDGLSIWLLPFILSQLITSILLPISKIPRRNDE